jgi:hypothetical protein
LDPTALCGTRHEGYFGGRMTKMEIKFRHDVDNVLKEAKKQNKPVLLDFSAAPM